jgi:hypothetical protein
LRLQFRHLPDRFLPAGSVPSGTTYQSSTKTCAVTCPAKQFTTRAVAVCVQPATTISQECVNPALQIATTQAVAVSVQVAITISQEYVNPALLTVTTLVWVVPVQPATTTSQDPANPALLTVTTLVWVVPVQPATTTSQDPANPAPLGLPTVLPYSAAFLPADNTNPSSAAAASAYQGILWSMASATKPVPVVGTTCTC